MSALARMKASQLMRIESEIKWNGSGYSDPTAYLAIRNTQRHISEDRKRFKKVLYAIFRLCDAAGFQVEGRIVLKDKRTGRIWR